MTTMTLGLDVSKRYLDMVAMDATGSVVERKRHTWTKLLERTDAMTPVRIGLEGFWKWRRLTVDGMAIALGS